MIALAAFKPAAYLETTIPSYLTAWPSRDLVRATHQQITKEWWRGAPTHFDLFISQTVIDEVMQGDKDAVKERLESLKDARVLPFEAAVEAVARDYAKVLQLPPKAYNDAVHLAYAVVFEMDYLVTWNMRHLANSLTMRRVTEFNLARSLHVPLLVTPEYLSQAAGQEGDDE